MKPRITSMASDGIIIMCTEKVRYIYSIDTTMYPLIKKTHNIGKVFDILKKHGILIEKEEL